VTNPPAQSFTTRQSVLLVFLCTLIGAAAQLHGFDPARILTDLPLLAGYACYALNTLLLMLALRDGELSKLYPIIALTFVWVNILSIVLFQERLNAWKVAGMLAIMSGVAMLGRASEGAEESRP
jgi:drug/metabolite transporter (DMT)-like permease